MKKGIELGIKAQLPSIKKASELADTSSLDYFLVPETHPEIMGVDAFEAIGQCSEITKNVTFGTGIVNVFSRKKEKLLEETNRIYKKTGGRLFLGLGTSAPIIVEQMYGLNFEKPVHRIIEYTKFLEKNFDGRIFWAAVGQKMIELSMKMADGVLFFLKPRSDLAGVTNKINKSITPDRTFQSISIVPTFLDSEGGVELAKRTLAGYIGANQFYSKPLIKAGYKEDVSQITNTYNKFGFYEACNAVSDRLIEDLTIIGSVDQCIEKINEYQKITGVNTVVAGFDLAKDEFNNDFFNKLERFLSAWK